MFSKLMLKSKLATAILTLSVLIMFAPGVTTAQESDGWNFRIFIDSQLERVNQSNMEVK